MFNPVPADASERLSRALGDMGLQGVCLFPAMHRDRLDDGGVGRLFESAARHKAVVFAHGGVLTVGVRKKLGLAALGVSEEVRDKVLGGNFDRLFAP